MLRPQKPPEAAAASGSTTGPPGRPKARLIVGCAGGRRRHAVPVYDQLTRLPLRNPVASNLPFGVTTASTAHHRGSEAPVAEDDPVYRTNRAIDQAFDGRHVVVHDHPFASHDRHLPNFPRIQPAALDNRGPLLSEIQTQRCTSSMPGVTCAVPWQFTLRGISSRMYCTMEIS